MAQPNKTVFLQLWPKCFIIFLAIIELIVVIILFLTELGNVAANFWITNVFAGGWCGLIMLIHFLSVCSAGCCSPGPRPAFRAAVIAYIGLVASAALISFDCAFIAQPTTCILTPSCGANSVSNTTFSYNFQRSFYTVFNSWVPFKSYTQSEVKLLCQSIQVGIGALSFLLCLIYLIVYYVCTKKAKQQVGPSTPSQQERLYALQQSYYAPPPPPPPAQQGYYPPSASASPSGQSGYYPPPPQPQQYQVPPQPQQYQAPPQPQYYQAPPAGWRPPVAVPQAQPGVVPWNANRRY